MRRNDAEVRTDGGLAENGKAKLAQARQTAAGIGIANRGADELAVQRDTRGGDLQSAARTALNVSTDFRALID